MPKDERHLCCFTLGCWFLQVDNLLIVKRRKYIRALKDELNTQQVTNVCFYI
jgi:hypothetical protein